MERPIAVGIVLGMTEYADKASPSFVMAHWTPVAMDRGGAGWEFVESEKIDDPCPLRFWPTLDSVYEHAAKSQTANHVGTVVILSVSHLPIPGPHGHDPRGMPTAVVCEYMKHPLLHDDVPGAPQLGTAALIAALTGWYINGEETPAGISDEMVQLTAATFAPQTGQITLEEWVDAFERVHWKRPDRESVRLIFGDSAAAGYERSELDRLKDDGNPTETAASSVPTTADQVKREAADMKAKNREIVYGKDK